jgi:hypothetical protein
VIKNYHDLTRADLLAIRRSYMLGTVKAIEELRGGWSDKPPTNAQLDASVASGLRAALLTYDQIRGDL